MNLARIQEELRKQQLAGWLFFDHHGRDPLAYRILGLGKPTHVTRRWYYLIPAEGEPRKLVHRIESKKLDTLPGLKFQYAGWQEHRAGVTSLLSGLGRVAMQYSPFCEIPYVAMVDAGTVELIRQTGCEVVTSAELIQYFDAQLSQAGLDSHLAAGRLVDKVRAEAFQLIAAKVFARERFNEFQVAEFVRSRFDALDLITENGPTVGVNANSANPHYTPPASGSSLIERGDFVLLDMWARLNEPNSIWYDITWTGFCGEIIPEDMRHVFRVVCDARDAAIDYVRKRFELRQDIRGFQVDDAARAHIETQGFGQAFIHRTGHSIGNEVHGNGANMDNFEIHDERRLIPWSCLSIEPGIYLERFGIRSEVNMFLTDSKALVTGAVQRELVQIT